MAPAAVHSPIDLFAVMKTQVPEEYYSQGLRKQFLLDGQKSVEKQSQPKEERTAEIGYDIDEAAFLSRSKASVAAGGLPSTVPDGWPAKLEGPLCWSKEDFQDESKYIYRLTDTDKAEIRDALQHFKDQGLNDMEVSAETFPLPGLKDRLTEIRNEIYEGRGLMILRGLDPNEYPVEDLTIVYLGISSYIGERRGKQDQRGSILMHVLQRNDEEDVQYSADKPFHTDTVTDCVCLFTQSLAATGGRSILASAWTVYNEIAATRPDLIHVLAQRDWPFDTFGRNPPFYERALMYYHKEKLLTSFSRRLLVGHVPFHMRTPGIPGLTERQAEALDAVHFAAKRHEISPNMVEGDMRFINNMALLHRREAFENDVHNSRHLVRIWLNNEMMCWKLPRDLRIAWARVFEDEGREGHYDIEPPKGKDGRILRVGGTCD